MHLPKKMPVFVVFCELLEDIFWAVSCVHFSKIEIWCLRNRLHTGQDLYNRGCDALSWFMN